MQSRKALLHTAARDVHLIRRRAFGRSGLALSRPAREEEGMGISAVLSFGSGSSEEGDTRGFCS